eukprot:CAMPEP_0197834038 /NCGR_PEP_ID=MMETSP1437-20131217/20952_1 /TAXON_ID=49252 ORGANISM="Eucampia antarctica, Strain CCMP1452" /NCGR_SAMPLE_ID=MMETSP1437 /ASSEMBLY_ACC=CAM_ASM_001096 /LENGTH=673 /DNA_ID=CAMNT_0043438425 /DNA_START=249 /DNA_END=2270 /DNA_ORIENTATION=+
MWIYVLIAVLMTQCDAFTSITRITTPKRFVESPSIRRHMSIDDGDNNNDKKKSYSDELREQAARALLEAERLEAELTLEKIAKLEKLVTGGQKNEADQQKVLDQIQILAKTMDPKSEIAPTMNKEKSLETNRYKNWKTEGPLFDLKKQTLTESELEGATTYFTDLPKPMQMALAKACDFENDTVVSPLIIVMALYERREELTPQKLEQLYRRELKGPQNEKPAEGNEKAEDVVDVFAKLVLEKDPEQYRMENMVGSLLPRVIQQEGKIQPSEQDAQTLLTKALGKNTFQPSSKPISIPGGYIIRGINKMSNSTFLMETIDAAMNEEGDWMDKFQVCYVMDPTPEAMNDVEKIDGDPVLLITTNDLSPTTNGFLLYLITLASFFLTLVFGVATYGDNTIVMTRLSELTSSSDLTQSADFAWFNELVTPFFLALAVPQVVHELGHLFMAWKNKFAITPPTIFPLVSLPYFTFSNKLKSSPKNYQALYEFAIIGPALGMICSLLLFIAGLQLTIEMDAEALKYAPALPVGFLNLSSLGGTLVDTFLGGGDGILLGQDPTTAVKLHPFAIAGLTSLMIQALDVIPSGSNDGGRISQSLLGRSGHLVFGGLVYFGILLYVIFNPDNRDFFLAFLLFNGFAQKDMEVPCRDEVQELGVPQAAGALLIWSVAILTLVPLS